MENILKAVVSPFGDSPEEKLQERIFVSTFAMLSKMASADGAISKDEVQYVDSFMKDVLKLDPDRRKFAIQVFTEARKSESSFGDFAEDYARDLADKPKMLEWMVDILLRAASADSAISENEEEYLRCACEAFSVSPERYSQLRARHFPNEDAQSYAVLRCTIESSDDEVRLSYERLCSEYHPEKIAKLGLPEEFLRLAEEKFSAIEQAYRAVKKLRGL